jgi:signal transduction histidine kinase
VTQADVIGGTSLYADANAQLVNYAATLEELTVSRERNRMARELHDTLAHTLSGVAVQLETAKAYWDVDPPAARSLLDKSLDTTRAGLVETRRALKALRASPLDDLGLAQALRQLAVETAARANLALQVAVPDQVAVLSPPAEQCLYRVAQEAVANVAQHAQARTLTVRLTAGSSSESPTVLLVQDDGIGFDADTAAPAGHFGLAGIRERARLVGGELAVTSRQGQGTQVRLSIPCDPWHREDLQCVQAERVRS